MNFSPVEKLANAVLYEGYLLYPYRSSSLKNRRRWNFGTLFPQAFARRQSPPEAFSFQAEVLIAGSAEVRVEACVRFLQLVPSAEEWPDQWSRGLPRSQATESTRLEDLIDGREFIMNVSAFNASPPANLPLRTRLSMRSERLRDGLWRVQSVFENETPLETEAIDCGAPDATSVGCAAVQQAACVSAHLLLGVEGGLFISLLEPPPEYEAEAARCVNRGVFPVLTGQAGSCSFMLCSPIILYDYPHIAPESSGDFFDSTEIDEMLALRLLTLSDKEKEEIRGGDPCAAAILDRTEILPGEHLLKLHGAVRGLCPAEPNLSSQAHARIDQWNPFEEHPPLESVRISGVDVCRGDPVRLRPARQADILDMAMSGKRAFVEAIEQDFEGRVQLAVVLDDDPGKDMGLMRQAAHRFFFTPEEIEPLPREEP